MTQKVWDIISWVFSSMLLLSGVTQITRSISCIFFILAGAILMPPVYKLIRNYMAVKLKFNIKTWQKSIAITLAVILAFAFMPQTSSTSYTQANANDKTDYLKVSSISSAASSKVSSPAPTVSSKVSSAAASTVPSSIPAQTTTVNGNLVISYIDVGQGDSELIQQGGQTMLIDAGTTESTSSLLAYLKTKSISKIDYLVLTHPHEDHIGGADDVINAYSIGKVYMPNVVTTTKAFTNVLTAMKAKGLSAAQPEPGSSFKLGDTNCITYGPVNTDAGNLNTYSIVIKLMYGNTKFLFTGDAESTNESGMLSKGFDLAADVLKVGHHGSDTSTSQLFLNAVHPKYSVIEVGKGNSYGHPTQAALNRLSNVGVQILRTDESGTIVCTSDGATIKFDKSASPVKPQAPPAVTVTPVTPPVVAVAPVAPPVVVVTPAVPATDNTRIVYWVPSGKSYHYTDKCSTLSRSKIILSGTLAEALAAGKTDPCDKCVK